MTLTLLLTLLAGPGSEQSAETLAGVPAAQEPDNTPFTTMCEARAEVMRVLRESSRAGRRDPVESTPAVAAVYRQLGASEKLPVAERRRLQAQLRTRLSELDNVLRRRAQRAARPHTGGVAANAQNLIDLIQTTIAPDSWEINGGKGSIFYFPNR
jgi:hypothetical protein